MRTGRDIAGGMSRAALAAAIAFLCVSATWARGQRPSAPAPRSAGGPAMRAAGPRAQNTQPARRQPYRPQYQNRPGMQPQGRLQGNAAQRPAPGYAMPGLRPGYPGSAPGSVYTRPGYAMPGLRPGYPGSGPGSVYTRPGYAASPYAAPRSTVHVYPGAAQPGHLGDWLNQHRGLPVQEQERMLRSEI